MAKKYLTIIVLLVSLLFTLPRTASAVDWFPIVPCGLNNKPANATRMDTLPDGTQVPHDYTQPCNRCLLIELGKNVIDLTFFGIVPAVGTLMFLIAGFIILFNAREGNSSGVTKGRQIMKDTAIGIAIILGAWLITNFILKSLAPNQAAGVCLQSGVCDTDASKTCTTNTECPGTPWYQIQCTTGTLKDVVDGTTPPPPSTVVPKYSCNSSNRCVLDPNGQYTSNVCSGNCQAPTGGVLAIATASLPDAVQNTAYTQSLSATGGTAPYIWTLSSGTLPVGLAISGSNISGTPTTTGTATFTVKVEDSSSAKQSATKGLTIKVNTTVAGTQCGNMAAVCSASTCKPFISDPALPPGKTDWTYLISSVASQHQIIGVDTAKFLEAIIRTESQGKIARQSGSTPPSCGLTQMQAGTANMFRQQCGINHAVTCDWLQGKALQAGETIEMVAQADICMAAEYAKSIKGGRCYGGQVRDIAAGYNGGDGCNVSINPDNALALSESCSSSSTAVNKYETDCSGRPTLRYECVFNNLSHTTCNTGFVETRDYVQQFNACYQ
ncbi:MAG: hypothetical protein A2735_03630 [Candidatus Yanofskybacteria bacterium RIFCSPHIGHO2_01_FULL_41_21]|uniref:Transglycosylase SLT domain-containing protein n=1 Tax=Candidatus Yanofskybacteria bacterium RIFCSPHIGHO2_01_FULL_41_21 TaxID=1802660 RepID=A0A1F8EAL4_9BACT|nr:MAG: hypothetical protein A2735_03630 [Candidatus Yanofskybacteria bacterium RIFCSPHIGHO2_01_FULL_41_21]